MISLNFSHADLLAHFQSHNLAPVWFDPQEGWLTYADVNVRVDAILPLYPTQKSLIALPFFTRTAQLIHYLAALRLGHAVILLDPASAEMQRAELCERFQIGAWVEESGALTLLKPSASVKLHPDLMLLLPTSGSTSSAKWVRLSKQNLLSNAVAIAEYLHITPSERAITSLSLYYSFGLSVLHTHLLQGASLVLTEASPLDRQFWELLEREQVTSLAGVPFTYQLLQRLRFQWERYPALRTLTQAGGRLEPKLTHHFAQEAQRLERNFFVMYGQTEAAPRMGYLSAHEVLEAPEAMGRAIPGGEFRLRHDIGLPPEQGELIYSGPNVMMGYASTWQDLERSTEVNELATGDIAYCDAAGRYHICGRMSRFLKLYGKRVALAEIEARLHDLGRHGACSGRDDLLLVAIEADIPPNEESLLTLKRELCTWLQLPPAAVRLIHLLQLPRTTNQKIDYTALKNLL